MQKRNVLNIFILLSAVFVINLSVIASDDISIIPKPVKAERQEGFCMIDEKTVIELTMKLSDPAKLEGDDEKVYKTAEYLSDTFERTGGFKLRIVNPGAVRDCSSSILMQLDDRLVELGDEGYKLKSQSGMIVIKAKKPVGLFYGVQTLKQLLPPEIYGTKKAENVKWTLPSVTIEDKPRFKWRGMHLDVGRHFFSKEFIKKYIDILAAHKMNTFHWHLTEDQGWRIEIKKYPKLTEIGAWRPGIGFGLKEGDSKHYNDKGQYGGFYTQDDIKEIVRYASERYITVVPEIELPGHAMAALTAYPEFSCTGGPFKIPMKGGVFRDVYCPGKEKTFTFLEDILSEVCELFPSEYIHIGGDECPKHRWHRCPDCRKRIKDNKLRSTHGLQSYTIKRVEKFLNKKGKKIIGWDEILEGGLAPNAAVMSWRGSKGGIHAARMKHYVVMSPNTNCYFDHYQADPEKEPKAIGGYLTMEKVYRFEPVPSRIAQENVKYILGAQANMWTEYMPNEKHVEYMLAPRICALSEVIWTPKKQKNWEDFQKRLKVQYNRMSAMDINYRYQQIVNISEPERGKAVLSPETPGRTIYYTLDGSDPDLKSPVYKEPVKVDKCTVIKARVSIPGGRLGRIYSKILLLPEARVMSNMRIHGNNRPERAFDGSMDTFFWARNPFNAGNNLTVAFKEAQDFKSLKVVTGKDDGLDILCNGILEISSDGRTFMEVAKFEKGIAEADVSGKKIKAVRLRITGPQKNWLFIREITFE